MIKGNGQNACRGAFPLAKGETLIRIRDFCSAKEETQIT